MKALNKINLKIFSALLVLAGILASCGIDDNINNSPNAINEENVKSAEGIKALTVSLQTAVADFYSGDRSRVTSIWTQQMCAPDGLGRSQPVAWNSYAMEEDGPVNDMWLIAYRGIRIANDIIKYTPEVSFGTETDKYRSTFLGIAKTYKGLMLAELAAFYGSIPIEIKGLEAPKFVKQRDAYNEAIKLFDEAIEHFKNTTELEQDLNYGGDGAKWTAAVNSLKARYYLHLSDYAKALAAAQSGIQAKGEGNDLFGPYFEQAGQYSPWGHWSLTEAGEPIRGEKTLVDLLKAETGDSRLAEYFKSNDAGNYWGYAQFEEATNPAESNTELIVSMNKYAGYGVWFPLISRDETLLIMAECKERTGGDGSGELNVIRTQAGLANYTGNDKIAEILKQKFIQLFLEGQAYHDMRRTKTLPNGEVPIRWSYPISEKNANPNVPKDADNLIEIWSK